MFITFFFLFFFFFFVRWLWEARLFELTCYGLIGYRLILNGMVGHKFWCLYFFFDFLFVGEIIFEFWHKGTLFLLVEVDLIRFVLNINLRLLLLVLRRPNVFLLSISFISELECSRLILVLTLTRHPIIPLLYFSSLFLLYFECFFFKFSPKVIYLFFGRTESLKLIILYVFIVDLPRTIFILEVTLSQFVISLPSYEQLSLDILKGGLL